MAAGTDAEAPARYPELTTADDGVVLSSDADAELLGEKRERERDAS